MLVFVKSCWITYRIAGRKKRRWDKAQKREREVRSSFKFMVFQHSIVRFESEWLPRGAIHLHVAWVSCIDDRSPMIDSTPCEFLKTRTPEWMEKKCWQSFATNELVFIATAHTTLHFCLAFFSRFEFKLNQCTWCRCSDELRFESNLLTHFDYWFRSQQQIEFESVMCSHTIWYVYTSIISNSVLNFAFHTENSSCQQQKKVSSRRRGRVVSSIIASAITVEAEKRAFFFLITQPRHFLRHSTSKQRMTKKMTKNERSGEGTHI